MQNKLPHASISQCNRRERSLGLFTFPTSYLSFFARFIYICRLEHVLRRAVTTVVSEVIPEYDRQDGEKKEFFVAFFNTGQRLRFVDREERRG